jgi:hypothetical protein
VGTAQLKCICNFVIDVLYDGSNRQIGPNLKRFEMQPTYPALALPDLEDVLERYPLTIAPETSVLEAIAQMSQVGGSHCDVAGAEQSSDLCHIAPGWNSCALVLEAGKLIGIFTERDVVRLTVAGLDLASHDDGIGHPPSIRCANGTERFIAHAPAEYPTFAPHCR